MVGRDAAARAGRWLFVRRGWLPLPVVVGLVASARAAPRWALVGLGTLAVAEALRLWGVAHIGARSRTRGPGVGALVTSGPFRWTRNPLYLGNIGLYAGLACLAGRPIVAPVLVAVLAVYYQLIVAWEEARLSAQIGGPYRQWAARVPRWLPRARPAESGPPGDWRAAIRRERSTFAVLAACVLGVAVRVWSG